MGGGGGNSGSSSSYTNPISSSGAAGGSGPIMDCSNLSFETNLQQPQKAALSKVEDGDVLRLRLPPAIKRVEVLNHDGEICGIIISTHLHTLIGCMDKGNVFEAAILKNTTDTCTVLVQRVRE